jgi:hypothetical protein
MAANVEAGKNRARALPFKKNSYFAIYKSILKMLEKYRTHQT